MTYLQIAPAVTVNDLRELMNNATLIGIGEFTSVWAHNAGFAFRIVSELSLFDAHRTCALQNILAQTGNAPVVFSVAPVGKANNITLITMEHVVDATPVHLVEPKSISREALATLTEAFNATGIVHGDISTGNILLDTRGRLVLIDFDPAVSRGNNNEDRNLFARIGNLICA